LAVVVEGGAAGACTPFLGVLPVVVAEAEGEQDVRKLLK